MDRCTGRRDITENGVKHYTTNQPTNQPTNQLFIQIHLQSYVPYFMVPFVKPVRHTIMEKDSNALMILI